MYWFFPIVRERVTGTPDLIGSGLDRNSIFLPPKFPPVAFARLVLQFLKETHSSAH